MSDKKIAVYCKTQEEYDIVAKHYGRKDGYDFKNFPCIKSDQPNNGHCSIGGNIDYKDVPFNEWILTEIPKVGDKVIITKSKENWVNEMDKYNNTIQIVNSIHSENGSNLHFEGRCGYSWNFSQKHFRLATPEEITKYEKSDIPTSCPEYVACIDDGRSYTTHPKAREYGCINYTKENCTNGVIYKVIATPLINDDTPGYVLEYDGKHYLINQKGTVPSTKEAYDAQFKKEVFKFEVDKWYSFNWDFAGKDKIVIAKISEISTHNVDISWRRYLWKKEDFSKNDTYNFNDISSIKELSIEEIQEYLPDGHEDKIPESKYKVGNELEACEGGWKLSEGDFHRDMIEINVKSNSYYELKGKCINTKWSSKNKTWFYKIESCDNMISESGVRLVNDKNMKEPVNTSKYSEYAIKLKSQEEYKKVLEYFKDKLNLPINYSFGYCNNWTYFGFDSDIIYNKWRLIHESIKEPRYPYSKVISLDEFIKITGIPMDEDVITEYAGLKVGDVLKEKDINNWSRLGHNYSRGGEWILYNSNFINDRVIKSFKELDGIIGFEVSNTLGIYLRADGYLDFINKSTKLIPKFSKGDKVKICSKEEDIDRNGYMYYNGNIEQIDGIAGEIKTLSGEITEKNGCTYYGYITSSTGYIKESCLSLVQEDLKESFKDSVVEIYTYPLDCLYKEGDLISCDMDGTFISEGKIHFEDGDIYICQNKCNGERCDNTLSYDYSWIIYDKEDDNKNSFDKCLNKYDITNLKLLQGCVLQPETDISSIDYQQKTLELYKKQISI